MFIKIYLITLPILLTLDYIWLGLISKGFYSNQIGYLMKDNINWPAAILFYLLFTIGLVIFVIIPSLSNNSISQVALHGLLFGLIAYATYDLTNLAIMKDWPYLVTLVDIAWGSILALIVSTLTYFIYNKF